MGKRKDEDEREDVTLQDFVIPTTRIYNVKVKGFSIILSNGKIGR